MTTSGDPLIDKISEAAYEVRKNLAPGYVESVYENALLIELNNKGLLVERQVQFNVNYKGKVIGKFQVDLLIEKRVIIELKAVNTIAPVHEAQLVNYLQTTGLEKGILINFGGERYSFRIKNRLYNGSSSI